MARAHETAADAVQVVGGTLLVGALFVPWTSEGPASGIAAHRVGSLLASGVLDALIPRWTAVLLYAGPLGGALAALAVGLTGRWRGRVELLAVVLVVVTLLPAVLLALAASPGGGALLTILGGGAVLVAIGVDAVVDARARRRDA